jgi:NAD(P)-dependent dehydrogenase (short-subunit alcohol dehydrogenase family)
MNNSHTTSIVIGANGGIGNALTNILLESGQQVIRGVRQMDEFSHASVKTVEVDATSWDSVDKLFEEAESSAGPVYGVALCVGSILIKPAHITREEEFDRTMALNLKSAFAVVRSASKRMMKTGGSIVLVSSCAALKGIPNHEAIAAAKAGVIGLAQSAAATYAHNGIRINCVAPGLTRSKMSSAIVNNEAALKASCKMHPLGRIGEPEEVARAIAWFLSPDQGWVTGQVLGIDGGLSSLATMPRG